MERFSRVAAVAAPSLLVVVVIASAMVLGLLAFIGGWKMGEGDFQPGVVLLAARALALTVLVMVVLIPLSAARSGAIAAYRRLLLLPIPRRALHLVEVLASLVDPWVAFALPGFAMLGVGIAFAGRVTSSVIALAAAIGITFALASLGSLVSMLTNWLMRSRRRGEMFTLVFVLVISVVGIIPTFVAHELERTGRQAKAEGRPRGGFSVDEFDQSLPVWTQALPSELYGRAIRKALDGRMGLAWLSIGWLVIEGSGLYWVSFRVHKKLIESAETGDPRRRLSSSRGEMMRLPGLTPGASAVAVAQARTALRSVRGRLVVLMPGPLTAALGLVSRRVPDAVPGGLFIASEGHMLLGAAALFSLYALQAFSMNQFASDRAGLTLQFLAPISDIDLVRGKFVGCGIVFGVALLICLVCSLIVSPGGSPLLWTAVLLGAAATYTLLGPVATFFSAVFPHASDLSKTGSGGNPHGLAMLIGTILVMVASGVTGLIIAIGNNLLERPALALMLMVLWAMVAVAVAIPLLRAATRAVTARRENLALVAQGR